jgi:hypothetical protein
MYAYQSPISGNTDHAARVIYQCHELTHGQWIENTSHEGIGLAEQMACNCVGDIAFADPGSKGEDSLITKCGPLNSLRQAQYM